MYHDPLTSASNGEMVRLGTLQTSRDPPPTEMCRNFSQPSTSKAIETTSNVDLCVDLPTVAHLEAPNEVFKKPTATVHLSVLVNQPKSISMLMQEYVDTPTSDSSKSPGYPMLEAVAATPVAVSTNDAPAEVVPNASEQLTSDSTLPKSHNPQPASATTTGGGGLRLKTFAVDPAALFVSEDRDVDRSKTSQSSSRDAFPPSWHTAELTVPPQSPEAGTPQKQPKEQPMIFNDADELVKFRYTISQKGSGQVPYLILTSVAPSVNLFIAEVNSTSLPWTNEHWRDVSFVCLPSQSKPTTMRLKFPHYNDLTIRADLPCTPEEMESLVSCKVTFAVTSLSLFNVSKYVRNVRKESLISYATLGNQIMHVDVFENTFTVTDLFSHLRHGSPQQGWHVTDIQRKTTVNHIETLSAARNLRVDAVETEQRLYQLSGGALQTYVKILEMPAEFSKFVDRRSRSLPISQQAVQPYQVSQQQGLQSRLQPEENSAAVETTQISAADSSTRIMRTLRPILPAPQTVAVSRPEEVNPSHALLLRGLLAGPSPSTAPSQMQVTPFPQVATVTCAPAVAVPVVRPVQRVVVFQQPSTSHAVAQPLINQAPATTTSATSDASRTTPEDDISIVAEVPTDEQELSRCPFCPLKFHIRSHHFFAHIAMFHMPPLLESCHCDMPNCGFIFNTRTDHVRHISRHTTNNTRQAFLRSVVNLTHRLSKMQAQWKVSLPVTKCPLCLVDVKSGEDGKKQMIEHLLIYHFKERLEKEVVSNRCTFLSCGKNMMTRKDLLYHLTVDHEIVLHMATEKDELAIESKVCPIKTCGLSGIR